MTGTFELVALDGHGDGCLFEMNKMMTQGAVAFLDAGTRNFAMWCQIGDFWLDHRATDLRAGAEMLHRLSACSEPVAILQASNEWLSDSCQRLAEEAAIYPQRLHAVGAHQLEALLASCHGLLSLTEAASRAVEDESTAPTPSTVAIPAAAD